MLLLLLLFLWLEGMVHQIEAETADLNENAGQGRIPSGFCTLTSAIYKWEQLHTVLEKSLAPVFDSAAEGRDVPVSA